MNSKVETTEDALVKIKINQSFISYHLQDKNMRWTALFVHGFNSSSDFAKPLFGLKTNYNIISVNLPGSRYLDHDEAELGVDFYVKLLETFIKQNVKSRKIVLVGHSLGGGIVAALSRLAKVKRVVYVAAINPHMIYARNWTALYDLFFGQGIHKSIKNMVLKAGARIYETLVDKNAVVREICDQKGRFVPIIKNYLLNTEYMSEILKNQYHQSLRKKPLFIIGDQDRVVETSRFVNFVEQDLGQKVIVLPRTKHNPFLTQADPINEILNQIMPAKKRFFRRSLIKVRPGQLVQSIAVKNAKNVQKPNRGD